MYLIKKLVLGATLGLALASTALVSQAAAISSMTITGGSFWMETMAPSQFTTFGNTNLVGGYSGMVAGFDLIPGPGANFGPVTAFTAASVPFAFGGGTVPTGDVTGSVITMDLSSWFWSWNGMTQGQGNSNATGTASCIETSMETSCTYTLAWDSLMVGGATHGLTGHWTLTGTAQVVPIPAAVWLLGSGLLGLFGVARRKPS